MSAPDFHQAKKPQRERLLTLLRDKAWHSWRDLLAACGPRYGARILELKREGFVIESRVGKAEGKDYRLVSWVKEDPPEPRVRVYLTPEDVRSILATSALSHEGRNALSAALKRSNR